MDRNTIVLAVLLMYSVALRKESVDRNFLELSPWGGWGVALRKESVDRNSLFRAAVGFRTIVALRKESVDRNIFLLPLALISLVALRKESVDRNCRAGAYPADGSGSLSARRAWIEIALLICPLRGIVCRSPQGERG